MFNSRFNKIQIVFLIIFGFFIFFSFVYSSQSDFETPKTCTQTFGNSCDDDTFDDAFDPCNGTQAISGTTKARVIEVFINASSFLGENGINVTCTFYRRTGNNTMQIWYNDTTNWYLIQHWDETALSTGVNYSTSFKVNSTEGTHVVRCMIRYCSAGGYCPITGNCVNDTYATEYDNDDVNFTVYQDNVAPNVTDFWFEYSDKTTNKTNLNTSLVIFANVSDNLALRSVKVNITYPDNTSINGTMVEQVQNTTWNFTFGTGNNTENLELNQTGNYTIRIYAIDRNGTEKASGVDTGCQENKTFYVNNTYTLNLTTNHTVYNRGEVLTIQVFDVNGNQVNVSWTVNLTRYNQSQETIYNETNTTYNYRINQTDPVVNDTSLANYTLYANVSMYNNTGNNTWTFNVSRDFDFSYSTIPSSPIPKGQQISLDVTLKNARDSTHTSAVNANISCYNSSYVYTMLPLNFSSGEVDGFDNCSAPNSYSTSFNITVNTSDAYNNTGEQVISLSTQSAPSGDGTTTGGGGGGGGVTQNVTIINVTANVTDFNFTLSQTEIQIYRGEDGSIVGALSNTGDTNLTLTSSVYLNTTCCVISINPSEFTLKVGGEEVPFTISIHVNTTTEPDTEHFADIKLRSGTLEKSKRIKIIVKENPTISSLNQITGQISEVEEKIREYAELGLNVGFLQDLLNKIKGKKAESTTAMQKDDINQLKQIDNFIQSSLKQINDELNKLAFLKTVYENKWNIMTGIAIGIVSTYLVTQIVIPYFRIEFEIRKLILESASLAKSRVETTKSFFLRKIDEKTFRSIISEGQGKIYKLKSMIDLKNEEKYNLLRTRLNPLYFGKWVKQKVTRIKPKKK